MSIKSLHHVCIQTERYEQSLKFYTEILGFEILNETKNFHSRAYNTWLRLGTFLIELQTAKEGEKLREWSKLNEGPVHLCFLAHDIHEELHRIKRLGYNDFKLKDGREIYEIEGGSLFKIKAPEGTEVEIRGDKLKIE